MFIYPLTLLSGGEASTRQENKQQEQVHNVTSGQGKQGEPNSLRGELGGPGEREGERGPEEGGRGWEEGRRRG